MLMYKQVVRILFGLALFQMITSLTFLNCASLVMLDIHGHD